MHYVRGTTSGSTFIQWDLWLIMCPMTVLFCKLPVAHLMIMTIIKAAITVIRVCHAFWSVMLPRLLSRNCQLSRYLQTKRKPIISYSNCVFTLELCSIRSGKKSNIYVKPDRKERAICGDACRRPFLSKRVTGRSRAHGQTDAVRFTVRHVTYRPWCYNNFNRKLPSRLKGPWCSGPTAHAWSVGSPKCAPSASGDMPPWCLRGEGTWRNREKILKPITLVDVFDIIRDEHLLKDISSS